MSVPSICNPWKDLPDHKPFILPGDRGWIEGFNKNAQTEHVIRLDLLPEPYLGNRAAPVILLNLNPGFSRDDLATHRDRDFARTCRGNLVHAEMEYPLFYLDPSLRTPGGAWWQRVLGRLLAVAPREVVARSLFCIEFFPYHSAKFRRMRNVLSSQEYSFRLVQDAMDRKALIVVMRGRQAWFESVAGLADYPNLCVLNSPQNVVISPNNCRVFSKIAGALQ